jgi:cytoskeletal protein RodZ
VAGNGPSDEFNNQQTTKAAYGLEDSAEPEHEGFQPSPWYRSPPLLIAWLLLVLILIALIVYGIGELIGGDEGTTPAPSSTTTSTTEPTSTTTPSTTPPSATTTTEATPPPTSSEAPSPTQQQPTYQPTNPPSTKHHPHLPTLPPGIHLPF